MALKQGVQMFMIPTSKSSCKETISQEITAGGTLQVDEEAYEIFKEPLGNITGESSLPAIGSPTSSCHGSLAAMPISGCPTSSLAAIGFGEASSTASGLDECDEEEVKDLGLKIKRCENLLKVGLSVLTPMKDESQESLQDNGDPALP